MIGILINLWGDVFKIERMEIDVHHAGLTRRGTIDLV